MKRSLALFFMILLCSRTLLAFGSGLCQSYDGEARPRAEVAWVWVNDWYVSTLFVDRIDHKQYAMPKAQFTWSMTVVEVLPGKHVFEVRYYNDATFSKVWSRQSQEVWIDAKAGENYLLKGTDKNERWQATITPYNPPEKRIEGLKRVKLEYLVSVDGVVQSWEKRHGKLILDLPGGAPTREFKCNSILQTGQKVRVFYYPSYPNLVLGIQLIE
ncbi:MAG: hypothetical protein ABSF70_02130 [Terracidiphilus sp.]|jgi:hypothetical protein